MPESDQYNVYNNYDPQFINYAELYKTPQEMKEKTEYLINEKKTLLFLILEKFF